MSPILEEGRNLFGATATVLRKNIWYPSALRRAALMPLRACYGFTI